MKFKKNWDLSLIVIIMRFKGKMSRIWDLKNKTSYYKHLKIKLHICVLLALKSHTWHVLNYINVDMDSADALWTLMLKEHLHNAYNCTCTGHRTPVPRCTQHSLQNKCTYMIYTYTHIHTHTYPQEYTCASMTPSKQAQERLLKLKIYVQTCTNTNVHMYIHACVYL